MWKFLAVWYATAEPISYDHTRYSVVRIQAVSSDFDFMVPFEHPREHVGLGTGWVVETDPEPLFVTNTHVIKDAHRVSLQLLVYGAQQWEGIVVSVCPKFDLALIKLKNKDAFTKALEESKMSLKALKTYEGVAPMGSEVVALGFPLGQSSLKISSGVIAGSQQVQGNACIQSTAAISPGNSGGPLMTVDGQFVVGVNFAKAASRMSENINYVIPVFRVRQMVNHHKRLEKDGKGNLRSNMFYPPAALTAIQGNAALHMLSEGCPEGVMIAKVGLRSYFNSAEPKIHQHSFLVSVNGAELDKFGQGKNTDYITDRVPFWDLFFMREDLDEPVKFKTCYKGNITEHSVLMKWDTEIYEKGVRYIHEPTFEDIEWEMFGDVSVMQMTVNHIQQVIKATGDPSAARWLYPASITTPKLIINFVRPGSYASSFLSAGACVTRVNGRNVSTLEEFRAAFIPEDVKNSTLADIQASKDQTVWTLETDLGKLYAVLFWETMVTQLQNGRRFPYLLSQAVVDTVKRFKDLEAKPRLRRKSLVAGPMVLSVPEVTREVPDDLAVETLAAGPLEVNEQDTSFWYREDFQLMNM